MRTCAWARATPGVVAHGPADRIGGSCKSFADTKYSGSGRTHSLSAVPLKPGASAPPRSSRAEADRPPHRELHNRYPANSHANPDGGRRGPQWAMAPCASDAGEPSMEDRIQWHLEHARHCGCRPIPDGVQKEIERRSRGAEWGTPGRHAGVFDCEMNTESRLDATPLVIMSSQ